MSIVPDVQIELSDGVDEYFHAVHDGPTGDDLNGSGDGAERPAALGCCGKLRAYMLYHYLPYDHGLSWLFSDPLWLTLKVLSMLPLLGTEFVVFFVYFFVIDKDDEYQLTRYILDLKGLAVFSMGIAHAASGAAGYFSCINTFFHPDELNFQYEEFYENGTEAEMSLISNGTLANQTCSSVCLSSCSLTDNSRLQVAEVGNSENCSAVELTCLECWTPVVGGVRWRLMDVVEVSKTACLIVSGLFFLSPHTVCIHIT